MKKNNKDELVLKFIEILTSKQNRTNRPQLLEGTIQNAMIYAEIFLEATNENRNEVLYKLSKELYIG